MNPGREGIRLPGLISLGALMFCGAAFVLLRWGEAAGWLPAWARDHGDDIISLPLVLAAALLIHRALRKEAAFVLPLGHGLVALAFFALYFEFLMPRWLGRGVADWWDVPSYALGWAIFQLAINRPAAGPHPGPD